MEGIIVGYGLEVEPELFDEKKVLKYMGLRPENRLENRKKFARHFEKFLAKITLKTEFRWEKAKTGGRAFIYYPMAFTRKNIAQKVLGKMLIELVKPYLAKECVIAVMDSRLGDICRPKGVQTKKCPFCGSQCESSYADIGLDKPIYGLCSCQCGATELDPKNYFWSKPMKNM